MSKNYRPAPKTIPASVTVDLTPPEISSPVRTFTIDTHDFQPKPEKKSRGVEDHIIIGFDTEYVVPPDAVTREDIRTGKAKYRVLSYQFHCIHPSGETWSGIAIPPDGERLSIGAFLVFALGSRPKVASSPLLPSSVYLVGHYTKADVPAFADFDEVRKIVAAVRGSFVSTDSALEFEAETPSGVLQLSVKVRDTFLLAPAGSQSLAALGDILGIPKVSLSDDPIKDREMKGQMDVLRSIDWPRFKDYAIHDAVICAQYAQRIIQLCETHLGKQQHLPVTLTSIGVDLLLQKWKDETKNPNALLGREVVKEKRWNKKRGHYQTQNREVAQLNYALYEVLATECYHGGRNEQYWFGPAFSDDWTDYDLSSAYATGMALIGTPDWSNFEFTTDVTRFGVNTLGYALIDFEFPDHIKFPSMPVRTENGLVFPMKGQAFCASPEILVARSLGANLTIKQGVVIASDDSQPIFANYIRHCVTERRKHPKKSLDDLFWKELSNSTYGKTAQGLREKRVYDSREMETVPLPPSKITNPYFAAYITSFVRAVIGEILNALPKHVCVFSCTTDGFLTNATSDEITQALVGIAANAFRSTRENITGVPEVLEIKHRVRCPLGWRTRGQATLVEGDLPPPANIVLAKGGLHLDDSFDSRSKQNDEVIRMFFDRKHDDRLAFETLTGIRDIVEFDADLVRKEMSRRVNMEFDWKRKPDTLFDSRDYKHCSFSTVPWQTVDQFTSVRALFDKYLDSRPHCIKSVGDFDSFSVYVDANMQLPEDQRAYLSKRSADIKRLRMMLCAAWHAGRLNLRSDIVDSAQTFADALSGCGVPCTRPDVENARNKMFVENAVPPTESVLSAIQRLSAIFPDVTPDVLCSAHPALVTIKPRRRPYATLYTTGVHYYQGFTIPGLEGRFGSPLQADDEIAHMVKHPDYEKPIASWLVTSDQSVR